MNKSITTPQEPLTITKVRWFRRQLKSWASGNLRNFPWRKTQDPYAILVAEFLLQKTNADTVAPVYQRFMERYPTLNALAAAPAEEVGTLLQPLGLAFRADRLRLSTQLILKNYKGKIPKTEAQLLKLPGVGKYTARSICAHAFGQRKAVLDNNVARILERFFGFCGGRVKWRSQELQEAAERAAPKTKVGTWNLALLDFAAAVCTARNPHCGECPLQEQCKYADRRNI
ncbi:A/G-specific adenine glycosylase [Argonema antarcticum]|uniref:A/G-specific adenine glycosylase n=1 Tax=Argonema antarcticum TaxID=2942763 RepID=UPI0020111B8C|nr:A/G-specific adenine glycosylase [Argonema antarcticum]MCL1473630.1 A/G-specific adenine glycosylase [Argonema antarcticum A004/B2]